MPEQQNGQDATRTSVELFAGGGGLAMGVEASGFRSLLFNEFARSASDSLEAAGAKRTPLDGLAVPKPGEPTPLYVGDVADLQLDYLHQKVDLLAGGPPCQPFSLGGVAKGDEDTRNGFPAMFKALREMQPKAFICENVLGLLRPSFKPYFDYILHELELPFEERKPDATWQEHFRQLSERLEDRNEPVPADRRYVVKAFRVNAADYGVPQIRHRVIIVGFRSDLGVDMSVLEKEVEPKYSEEALHEAQMGEAYWAKYPDVPNHVKEWTRSQLSPILQAPLEGVERKLPWRTLRDAIAGEVCGEPALPPLTRLDRIDHLKDLDPEKVPYGGIKDHIGWPDARFYTGHTPNYLDRPAKTVKAGVHGVPGGESVMLTDELVPEGSMSPYPYVHRYMSVRETARVMTFPDERALVGSRSEQMRQLGNAVPVLLGEVFAQGVMAALAKAEHK
ncbi:DNA (cytosine-5)-methyltransferase 1 [Catenulispora sp. MAP12-49]|uniref:DNA cytosine methyltransferase n=1 Tax=Catenulispora sp. MAP12-49 TaxID=3156302 RepID=UPI003513FC3D